MVKQLTRSAVRIYGALTALGNESGDVLEGLLPFFDPILRQHNHSKLDPDVIAAAIRDTYKWNFNSDLVEAFVPYLVRYGWVVADIPDAKDTTYTIHLVDNAAPDPAAQDVEKELRRIAFKFKEFSEGLSPLTALPRGVEEFEDILVEWLLYVEAFSEGNIEFKTGFKPDETGKLRKFVEVPSSTSLRDEERFLCARFVKHAIEEDEGSAEVLARIAAIGLLTEVVQDFVKPVTSVEKTDLIVYLDAPVAMELLGVSGKSARENTEPIISELTRIGASVRIFGQSIDEIRNSLQAVLNNPRPTGPTAQSLLKREVLREYVVEVSRNPAALLEKHGVKTAYRTLEQTPSEHKFFTKEHWEELYGRLNYSENPHAREHDADIAAFVVRQRHGKTDRDLFKSQVVALTRNGLLAQIVRRACFELNDLPRDSVPPVVHRRVLATAMWLRTGMGAGDLNIPKRMLLASCERVLGIRPGVVDAVKRLTDALGDAEKAQQLDLLISQDRSAQALMDKTLGLSNVVTEDNLSVLWQEMLHPHLEQEREKGRKAVSEVRSKGKKRLAQVEEEFEKVRKEKEEDAAKLGEKLEVAHREDRDAVVALCIDVSMRMRRENAYGIGSGLILALIFSVPLAFDTAPAVKGLAFVTGWFLAYLTTTGGRLVRTGMDESRAVETLHNVAERRGLSSKIAQFDVKWDKSGFVVSDRRARSSGKPRDLFGRNRNG